jgi:hypothetical protein
VNSGVASGIKSYNNTRLLNGMCRSSCLQGSLNLHSRYIRKWSRFALLGLVLLKRYDSEPTLNLWILKTALRRVCLSHVRSLHRTAQEQKWGHTSRCMLQGRLLKKNTPWAQFASELYRPSDRRLRSWCQLLWIEGATWSAWRIPTALFSIF